MTQPYLRAFLLLIYGPGALLVRELDDWTIVPASCPFTLAQYGG
jgi:hypothetical protein